MSYIAIHTESARIVEKEGKPREKRWEDSVILTQNTETGKLLISFARYPSYTFDMRFANKLLSMDGVEGASFRIDIGQEVCVDRDDVVRVIRSMLQVCEDKGFIVREDEYADFRETGIGQLTEKLGFL